MNINVFNFNTLWRRKGGSQAVPLTLRTAVAQVPLLIRKQYCQRAQWASWRLDGSSSAWLLSQADRRHIWRTSTSICARPSPILTTCSSRPELCTWKSASQSCALKPGMTCPEYVTKRMVTVASCKTPSQPCTVACSNALAGMFYSLYYRMGARGDVSTIAGGQAFVQSITTLDPMTTNQQ